MPRPSGQPVEKAGLSLMGDVEAVVLMIFVPVLLETFVYVKEVAKSGLIPVD